MILAFDTYYIGDKAKTVCLAFASWADIENFEIHSEILGNIAAYTPGEFYKRELPCILSLLGKVNRKDIEAIVIDGFVYLDDDRKLGLGGHLYLALQTKVPVIGVAKTNFATIEKHKRALFRGKSERPLFITSIGMEVDKATELIKSMSGDYRIPLLLKKLDTLTKE
jgi:exodeoxyribonuclease-5/deoxyribonuclease V